MGEFYGGVESLTNGVTSDKRYHGKKRRMNRPQIFIFTNVLPDFVNLTPGVWDMKHDKSMIERVAGTTGQGVSFLIRS